MLRYECWLRPATLLLPLYLVSVLVLQWEVGGWATALRVAMLTASVKFAVAYGHERLWGVLACRRSEREQRIATTRT